MISLYDSNITDILPERLSEDPKTKALGYAIKKAMQRLIDHCKNISVYSVIDTVPEQVLDLLAVELNTQYYDDAMNVEIKRSLIKNTLIWYMNTGTPASVEEAVVAVFGNGEVEEWFDYGGEPFHFKVHTSTINSTDEMIQQLTEVVSRIQNARSYLEEVVIELMQSMNLYVGCKMVIMDDITIKTVDIN